jgi:glycosyltransferase involved in cell wall biosynthesis
MNVAILHYHFNRGGVTQVVLNHLQALDRILPGSERIKVALIHGGRSSGITDTQVSGFRSLDVSMHSFASLDYDDEIPIDEESLASELLALLENAGFPPKSALLHVHNHSLGKNVALPGAIRRLSLAGYRSLLQIHDFAEDLRPDNYRKIAKSADAHERAPSMTLYPQAAQIHYAVLNRRDYNVLDDAGVPDANLHLLPNAAGDFGELPSRALTRQKLEKQFGIPPDATYILYPVRGIRRKNLGEVLLWSALAPQGCFVGVTLAPLNPLEQVAYRHWVQLGEELDLPCMFATGGENGLEFKENLAAADLILTTSVAEGFGMVFLEAWLAGRNLVGRDLPEITADFVDAGIKLETLYPQLLIPVDWVGADDLREPLTHALNHLLDCYGIASSSRDSTLDQQLSSLLQTGNIDFGMLDSSLQTRVIRMVLADGGLKEQLFELNPKLLNAINPEADEMTIADNADVVRKIYSLEASGKRLKQLYDCVMESDVETDVQTLAHPDRILNTFLDVTRLYPVRFEE